MPKIKDLHGAIDSIDQALQNAQDEVETIIKIKHPKKYTMDEYEERIKRK